MLAPLGYLDMIVNEAERPALAATVRQVVSDAAKRLGWDPRPDEDELTRQLRGALWGALGTLGDDPEVQRRATENLRALSQGPSLPLTATWCRRSSVFLLTLATALAIDEFKQHFKSARTPQEEQRYLFSLAHFRRMELLRATMDLTLSGEVRTQNAPYLMHALLVNTASRYEAWDFVKKHWEEMIRKFPDNALPRMCEAIVGLLERDSEVHEFFQAPIG